MAEVRGIGGKVKSGKPNEPAYDQSWERRVGVPERAIRVKAYSQASQIAVVLEEMRSCKATVTRGQKCRYSGPVVVAQTDGDEAGAKSRPAGCLVLFHHSRCRDLTMASLWSTDVQTQWDPGVLS
jgi:hypothetical protein